MKYEGTRPSGKDKDIMVHKFVVGKEEMRLLKQILTDANKRTPNTTETSIMKRRLENMRKVLEEAI